MTAFELKLATAIARSDRVLTDEQYNPDILFGFGLPDFEPVHVTLFTVARCLRWQCQQWNGGWDEKAYNDDRPHYLRNVEISDLTAPEIRKFLVAFCVARLESLPQAA